MIDTMPPCSEEAECAALGAMIANPEEARRGIASLTRGDFFIEKNAMVFDALAHLIESHSTTDFVTLTHALSQAGTLNEIGGAAYISRLINIAPSLVSVQHYAGIIKERALDRQLLRIAEQTAKSAFDGTLTTSEKVSSLYDSMRHLRMSGSRSERIGVAANELFDDVELWAETPLPVGEVRGFSLGIPKLDYLTGGLHGDDLTVLTARPGIGKTALALQIADTLAEQGKRILFYSLEMRRKRVARRLASRRAMVDFQKIERGHATSDELARIMAKLSEMTLLPFIVNDDSHATTAMISAEIDAIRPDLVIIDNINIMTEPQAYASENDVKRIGRISRNLKISANDFMTPIIAIAHLNRQSEARADKRPTLADLRDSGEIEQNADNVLGMYRDIKGESQSSDIVEVWPLKLRDGDISRPTKFYYNGTYYLFAPMERDE
jgi:replicative DNA helicase